MTDNKASSGSRRFIRQGYPLVDRIRFAQFWRGIVAFLRKSPPADATNTQQGDGPIGYCRYCSKVIYTTFGEHFDTCPEFNRKIDDVWLRMEAEGGHRYNS